MKLITAPIDGTSAADVIRNLHDALLFILQLPILSLSEADRQGIAAGIDRERPGATFARGTVKAIGVLQEQLHLSQTMAMDEATAEAFNRVLRTAGAFDVAAEPRAFVVSGRVRSAEDAPLIGVLVRAFHQADNAAIRLGEDVTDPEGRYTIRYELLPNVPAIQLRIAVTRGDVAIVGSELVPFAKPLEVIDLTAPLTADAGTSRRIEGRVVFESGRPAVGVTLRLYRPEFGADAPTRLQEVTSGEQGTYRFGYEAGDASLSLQILAADAAGTEVALTEVMHGLATEPVAYLNLAAPESLQPLAAEFTRMATDLSGHLPDMEKLADARENADRQDFTLLNAATGWDARLIALASKAARVSKEASVGLSQPVLYGLFRAGLPSDSTRLAYVDEKTVDEALTKIRKTGIVDLSDAEVTTAKAQFAQLQEDVRLSAPVPGASASYKSMLADSGLTPAAQTAFANVYLSHSGPPEKLWADAKAAGVADDDIVKLQRQGQLAFLTRSQTLTTSLQKDLAISDPAQLVDKGLYDASKWKDTLETLAVRDGTTVKDLIPPSYRSESPDGGLAIYTEDMARKVRITYPTQVLAHQIEQAPDDAFQLGSARTETVTLLREAAAKGFTFGQTSIDAFERVNPALFDSLGAAAAPVQKAIRTLQRVYQMTPSDAAMPVLLSLGFTSAFDIVALSEDVFLERHGAAFPTREQARLIYRKAQQVSSVTHNLFTIARKIDGDPPLYGVTAPADVRDSVRHELIKQFPTMGSLFGSMDYCECEHCRSVLSPAAYLVDLLQFIDNEAPVWNSFLADWKKRHGGEDYTTRFKKPYDALIERRPDLPNIALTCDNTHTALPYIDVVNEILEYYVAHGALTTKAARDTVDVSSVELLAEPATVIAEAYEKLESALYPIGLPFDLWLETARRFISYFETSLTEVLEIFRPGDELFAPGRAYDRAAIACESIGLSPAEAALFAAPPLATWFELYGFSNEADAKTPAVDAETKERIDLNSAKTLSRRLGITYKELVDIVQTGFVNPALPGLVTLHKLRAGVHDVLHYVRHRKLYEDNKDLIGQTRDALAAPDQDRFDAIDQGQWEALAEVQGFEARLEAVTGEYAAWDFDAKQWLDDALGASAFDDILVLADPQASVDFDQATLNYGFRAEGQREADAAAFLKINLFVRLWRKLGWTIEETDRALRVLAPPIVRFDAATLATAPLETALINIARLKALDDRLGLGTESRIRLLTLWSPLPTDGRAPLYARLFLQSGRDEAFDDPLGRYLAPESLAAMATDRTCRAFVEGVPGTDAVDPLLLTGHPRVSVVYDPLQEVQHAAYDGVLSDADKAVLAALSPSPIWPGLLDALQERAAEFARIGGHLPALQGALGLSAAEIALILPEQGERIETAPLTLHTVSLLHRYRLLATGLRLSVPEVVALKQLSGLDPFPTPHAAPMTTLAEDHLLNQTHRFVDVAAEVKASGLQVADVDYLLRHRFDPTGKYRPDPAAVAALFSALSEGIDAIHVEHAWPEDPGVVTDEYVRQKLGIILPPEAVDRTLRGLSGTGTAEMRPLFDTYLAKQAGSGDEAAGALEESDFTSLFGALTALQEIVPGDTPAQVTAKEKANEQIARDNDAALADRRYRLAIAFLPVIRLRLARELVVQSVTAHLATDRGLVEMLVTDSRVLRTGKGAEARPLLDSLRDVGARGLTAHYFASTDASGAADTTDITASADTAGHPASTSSARFEGTLQVPATGVYRLTVAFSGVGPSARLRFAHDPAWGLDATAGATLEAAASLALQAGVVYPFSLTVSDLRGADARLLVQGDAVAKGDLDRLALRPAGVYEGAADALMRLAKTMQLVQAFGLREREVRHLATHGADFADLDFSDLPIVEREETPALFAAFLRLATYARLKRQIAPAADGLTDVFDAPDEATAHARLARHMRRDVKTIKAVARALSIDYPIADERPLARLRDGLSMVERLGAPVGSIVSWTRIVSGTLTADARQAIADDLRDTVKGRFTRDTWQRVAQPIFDDLRQRKRDALVAHVMHRHGFARLEQVYEYFLIDPGMEPVVQTSRIRLATSCVQLFIQRCLLNLERTVHPAAIDGNQWAWMKAYRVWEANRKIFLFPENWLEPEFRDDKTHLFRELEGTLLQADVSADLVEDALLQYLRKLNELARLEVVAMHLEDKPDPSANRLHVIGRSYGEPHKYFYRSYAHQMWTPWEPITADISGEHLAPVIWRERLFLFWVTFMEVPARPAPPARSGGGIKNSLTALSPGRSGLITNIDGASARIAGRTISVFEEPAPESTFNALTLSELSNRVLSSASSTVLTQVQLHWSEYARGEWTTRESGGVASSFVAAVPFGFTPLQVPVHVSKDREGDEDRAVYIHLGGPVGRAFKLAGRNSTPTDVVAGAAPRYPYNAREVRATRFGGSGALTVTLNRRITTTNGGPEVPAPEMLPVMGATEPYTLLVCDNEIGFGTPEIASLVKPFFYQDSTHTYYVEPSLEEHTIEQWNDYLVKTPVPDVGGGTSATWPDPIRHIPDKPKVKSPYLTDPGDPVFSRPLDKGSLYSVKTAGDWLVNDSTGVLFDGEVIGPSGRAGLSVLTRNAAAGAVLEGARQIEVPPGSEIPPGGGVFIAPGHSIDRITDVIGHDQGLTLVGGSGLTQVVEQNVGRLNRLTPISGARVRIIR